MDFSYKNRVLAYTTVQQPQ